MADTNKLDKAPLVLYCVIYKIKVGFNDLLHIKEWKNTKRKKSKKIKQQFYNTIHGVNYSLKFRLSKNEFPTDVSR